MESPNDIPEHSEYGEVDVDHTNTDNENEERKSLARRETYAVWTLRGFLLLTLSVTATLVCIGVYRYIERDEMNEFETQFDSYAKSLIESFYHAVSQRLIAMDDLSASITSHAISTDSKWPNVTFPGWEVKAATSRLLADTTAIDFSPVVTDEDRLGWEAYARSVRDEILDDFHVEQGFRDEQDIQYGYIDEANTTKNESAAVPADSNPPREVIWGVDRDDPTWLLHQPYGTGPYLPGWQASPSLPNGNEGLYMFNYLTYDALKYGMLETMRTAKLVIDRIPFQFIDGIDNGIPDDRIRVKFGLSQFRYDGDVFLDDPVSPMSYPVFDTFNKETRQVVGLIACNLYWRLLFLDALPETAKGVIAVVADSFGGLISYQIDGSKVTYLGESYRHDDRYDKMAMSADVFEDMQENASPQTRPYFSVGLSEQYCRYTLTVYPSDDTKEEFVTSKPALYTLVVAAVFLFSYMLFVTYDFSVELRQKVVMNRAVKSGAIVSSLYPKAVLDRLFEDDPSNKKRAKKPSSVDEPERPVTEKEDQSISSASCYGLANNKAIADLYPNCTIMFLDLAGFTRWSATKCPTEVFFLLETLYQAFDALAVRMKVFKVETIGDCYMAAAGVPDPCEDHAVVMVRFATECMRKMRILMHGLVGTLGEETLELGCRVGLHSGPVTAGVLRGQKSRFQLFGDTVNTASRMESTGVVWRIHVSQNSANELEKAGKGDWITQREEKIIAKGKGEMQTYWAEVLQ